MCVNQMPLQRNHKNYKTNKTCDFHDCNKRSFGSVFLSDGHTWFITICSSHCLSLLLGGHTYMYGEMWNTNDYRIAGLGGGYSAILGHKYNVCA